MYSRAWFIHLLKSKLGYFLFVLASSFLLTLFTDNFKIHVAVVVLLLGICYYFTQNLFLALFTLFVISVQFQVPGKYYTFDIIEEKDMHSELAPQGVTEGYGLIASDIFAFFIFCLWIREIFIPWNKPLTKIHQSITSRFITVSWIGFFMIALYSSINFSRLPEFSIFVWFQYLKLPLIFISVKKILTSHRQFLITLLVGILTFQNILGFTQVITGFAANSDNSRFRPSFTVPEEDSLMPRSTGSFGYGNQFALTITILLFVVLILIAQHHFSRPQTKQHLYIVLSFTVLNLLFAQSRVIWLSMGLLSLIFIMRYKKYFTSIIDKIATGKNGYYFTLVVIISAAVIFPRLFQSRFFFDKYGGGDLRLQMIEEGLIVLQGSPWVGNGLEMCITLMWESISMGYISYFPFAIHFAYLQIALEVGVLGSILLFTPMFTLLWSASKKLIRIENKTPFQIFSLFFVIVVYYSFHPLNGRVELPFLGLACGIGLHFLETLIIKKNS